MLPEPTCGLGDDQVDHLLALTGLKVGGHPVKPYQEDDACIGTGIFVLVLNVVRRLAVTDCTVLPQARERPPPVLRGCVLPAFAVQVLDFRACRLTASGLTHLATLPVLTSLSCHGLDTCHAEINTSLYCVLCRSSTFVHAG